MFSDQLTVIKTITMETPTNSSKGKEVKKVDKKAVEKDKEVKEKALKEGTEILKAQ